MPHTCPLPDASERTSALAGLEGRVLGLEGRMRPRSFMFRLAHTMSELALASCCLDVSVRRFVRTLCSPRDSAPKSLRGGFPAFRTSQGRFLVAWDQNYGLVS